MQVKPNSPESMARLMAVSHDERDPSAMALASYALQLNGSDASEVYKVHALEDVFTRLGTGDHAPMPEAHESDGLARRLEIAKQRIDRVGRAQDDLTAVTRRAQLDLSAARDAEQTARERARARIEKAQKGYNRIWWMAGSTGVTMAVALLAPPPIHTAAAIATAIGGLATVAAILNTGLLVSRLSRSVGTVTDAWQHRLNLEQDVHAADRALARLAAMKSAEEGRAEVLKMALPREARGDAGQVVVQDDQVVVGGVPLERK